jgi:hypothetical protein
VNSEIDRAGTLGVVLLEAQCRSLSSSTASGGDRSLGSELLSSILSDWRTQRGFLCVVLERGGDDGDNEEVEEQSASGATVCRRCFLVGE